MFSLTEHVVLQVLRLERHNQSSIEVLFHRALTKHSITHYALHNFTLSIVIFDSCISYTNMEDVEKYLPKMF